MHVKNYPDKLKEHLRDAVQQRMDSDKNMGRIIRSNKLIIILHLISLSMLGAFLYA